MLKDTLKKGIAQLPDLRNKDGSRVDGTSEKRPRAARCSVATGSMPVASAFGIFLDGHLQMIDCVQPGHQAPAIYMTLAAAQHHCRDDEAIVPLHINRAPGKCYAGTEGQTKSRQPSPNT